MQKKVGILIPAFNPDNKLVELVATLSDKTPFERLGVICIILVVNDGSFNNEVNQVLERINKESNVKILSHSKNLGKGKAIKTGVTFLTKNGIETIVTVDADGQHDTGDILKVLAKSLENDEFVLGERSLSHNDVPLKSKIGNKLSSLLFYCFTGTQIKDTQSGLRAFPKKLFEILLGTKGSRYDYEFSILIQLARSGTPILKRPIKTLYFENNKKTSFRPVIDSLLVYSVFLRYSIVALAISLLDLSIMYIVTGIYPTTISFLIVRVLTTHLYFYVMKMHVFKSRGKLFKQLSLYYILVLMNIFISWQAFNVLFFRVQLNFFLGYFVVIIVMVAFNFLIQKYLVFK